MNKNQTKKNLNNRNKTLIIGGLGMLMLGGILSYFTDTETKHNKFTVGNVDIQLVEEKWNAYPDVNKNDIPDIAETLTPLKSIEKDPLIKNIGTNDAWVYLEVKVPIIKNIVVADETGIKQPAGDTELFSFIKNEGWTELGTKELDDSGENMIYVYGYNNALSSKQDTPTLFDTIKFANVIEGQGIENIEKTVVVTAKAIQTDGTGTMQEAYDNNFKRGQVAGDQYEEFTLTFNTDGATLPTDFKTVYEKGTIVELPQPNKVGYDFVGWYTNPEFEGTPIISVEVTKDISLYTKWKTIPAMSPIISKTYNQTTIDEMPYFTEQGNMGVDAYVSDGGTLSYSWDIYWYTIGIPQTKAGGGDTQPELYPVKVKVVNIQNTNKISPILTYHMDEWQRSSQDIGDYGVYHDSIGGYLTITNTLSNGTSKITKVWVGSEKYKSMYERAPLRQTSTIDISHFK